MYELEENKDALISHCSVCCLIVSKTLYVWLPFYSLNFSPLNLGLSPPPPLFFSGGVHLAPTCTKVRKKLSGLYQGEEEAFREIERCKHAQKRTPRKAKHASYFRNSTICVQKAASTTSASPAKVSQELLYLPTPYFNSLHQLIRYLMINHLEERLLDQAQARVSYTPPFLGLFA